MEKIGAVVYRDRMITLRLSEEERAAYQQVAARLGLNVSGLIRVAVREYVARAVAVGESWGAATGGVGERGER